MLICSFAFVLRFYLDKSFLFPPPSSPPSGPSHPTLAAELMINCVCLPDPTWQGLKGPVYPQLMGSVWSLLPPSPVHTSWGLTQACLCLSTAEACVEPQITPSYYTTTDAVISTETVFIVEISLTCKNRVQVRQWGSVRGGPGARGVQ